MSGDLIPGRPSGIIPPPEWPEALKGHPELAGLFVGGCVDRGVGSSFRAKAHAHIRDPHKGWICVRGWRRLASRQLMLHELAHIISGQGHTAKWRAALRSLGGRVDVKPRPGRKPCKCGRHRFGTEGATFFYLDPVYRFHSWARCELRSAKPTKPWEQPRSTSRKAAP